MNLLEAVECHLGPINDWPSGMLINLFTNYSTWLNAAYKLKEVIAFFHGNGIPIDLACQFFQACNVTTSSDVNLMFHKYYCKWRRSRFGYHLAWYYIMRLKKRVHQRFVSKTT
jgi:hypothetical protein